MQSLRNVAAPGVSWFTPEQVPPSGEACDPQSDGRRPSKLFQPLKIRGLTLRNRIWVSPMCQYSAEDGHLTLWHLTHLGGIIQRGPGLTFIEATAVSREGRITPEDSGLWTDSQMVPLKQIVDFAHSQDQKVAIQLGHAGRKASTVAPWLSRNAVATEDVGGWPHIVYGPSALSYDEKLLAVPKAMTLEDIQKIKEYFVAAVKRALAVNVDVIEIHAAHGYLFHEFLSPVSNIRTDQYGGSFQNRTRFLLEVIELTRGQMPSEMPLFVRISATDWLEEVKELEASWDLPQSIRLSKLLAELGVDLIDVSSGALHPKQQVKLGPGYQSHLAKGIKNEVGDSVHVTSVGAIANATLAQELVEWGLDAVMVGRGFQKNPGLVWTWAEELGVETNVAKQIRWAVPGGKVGLKK